MNAYVTTHTDGNTLKNEPATSGRTCSCGSWIAHWKKYADQRDVPLCIVSGCPNQATDGAHVEFTRVKDWEGLSFIAPMCGDHNKDRDLAFMSKGNYRLARGNQAETCGI